MAEDFQPQCRLHAMSWLFGVITFIRQFLVPLLAAALFGSKDGMPLWLGAAIVPMIGIAIWKQIFYRYGCGPDGLVVRDGVLFHNVRQIDYGRIENLDTQRNLLHRLFNVTEVRVETSTGGKPEARIQVLSLQAAQALRETIFAARSGRIEPEQVEETETTLLHLPVTELVRFGLIDNRGMVVVAALFGLVHEAGLFETWGAAMLKDRLSTEQFDGFLASGFAFQAALALGALIAALLLVRLFSVALAVFTLYDFKLSQVRSDLRVRYGSLTRMSLTLRLPRIQAIHQTETLLHRWLQRVSLRVDLAGGVTEEHEGGSPNQVRWLAPVAQPECAAQLAQLALPQLDLEKEPQWQPLASGATRRIFNKSAALWIGGICLLAGLTRNVAPLSLLAIGLPVSLWYARGYVRYTRWALKPGVVLFRSGWLTRKLVIVPRSRIQCALIQTSPFDRRSLMADVAIDTAGAAGRSGTVRIPYLEQEVANSLAHALYLSSATGNLQSADPVQVEAV